MDGQYQSLYTNSRQEGDMHENKNVWKKKNMRTSETKERKQQMNMKMEETNGEFRTSVE